MAKAKDKAKLPSEGILDPEVPKDKEIEFKGEVKEGTKETTEPVETNEEDRPQLHLAAKAILLRNMIDLCADLVNDIKLKVRPKGVKIQAVDPAHVCLVDIDLKSGAFDEYEASDLDIGLSLEKLHNILKLAAEGNVEIDYDADEKRLIIKMDTLTRRMGIIDPEGMPDPSIPRLVTPAKFEMLAQRFLRTLNACEQITDHMRITVDKTNIELFAELDSDTVVDKIPKELLTKLETTAKFVSLYSLDYLKIATKGAKENIAFNMSNDNPIQIQYTFAEGKGEVTYVLAPRIEPEDAKEEKKK